VRNGIPFNQYFDLFSRLAVNDFRALTINLALMWRDIGAAQEPNDLPCNIFCIVEHIA
jgi:hypothetical protein